MRTEEDEAFDDLAKKQGDWGGGFKAKQAMAKARVEDDDDIQGYKKPWVSLTDAEIDKTYWRREPFRRPTQFEFARDIEQLLKEKNNG
tara:strand:+ start:295 stop:558 length:264 start_codon:yes stop_codon:yes gene_type:complete